jgi:hypothetical protein
VFDIASSFKKEIEEEATRNNQSYADELMVSKINGTNDFVVHVSPSFKQIGSISNAAYYYHPINEKVRVSPLNALLGQFAPYPKELLPMQPGRDFRLIFRKVTSGELETLLANLNNFLPQIIESLRKLGVSNSSILDQSKIEDTTLVQEDLWFNVLRKELGIKTEKIPIWTQAIDDFRKGLFLKDALKEKLSSKEIEVSEVGKSILGEIEDFLEKILKE